MSRVTTAYSTPLHSVIRDQISAASGAAIFVGGFAYVAVNFFKSPSADGATMYLWLMGLVFGLCMVCVAFGSFILLELEQLESEAQEEAFAIRVLPLSRLTFIFFTLAMLLHFQGLIHMGHTKREWYVHVTEGAGWTGFCCVFFVAWMMPLLAHKAMVVGE